MEENDDDVVELTESLTQDWFADEDDEVNDNDSSVPEPLMTNSKLHILQKARVEQSYQAAGVAGLFRLFITDQW